MKKILLFLSALIPMLTLSAQSMYIYQGEVVTMVSSISAGDMTYTSTALSVKGINFTTSTIDSIVFNNSVISTDSIAVKYAGTKAFVYVPIELLPSMTITATNAHVAITSALTADPEVKYGLYGTATDGSFLLEGDYKCTVCLSGVNLTSSKGAAIHIKNGKRIDVILTPGTTNTLSDYASGTQDACFHIKGHAEFKGSGTLNIAGNAHHAYKSGEYTLIKASTGTINITAAKNDGMHCGQYFQMNGGTINVNNVKGDGIQAEVTNNKADELNGQMILNGGTVTMVLANDTISGLKCDSLFTTTGGSYNITVSGAGARAVNCATNAIIKATNGTPVFTLYVKGGTIDVAGNNKKSAGFKIDGSMYFHAGTINAYPTGNKSKGINVGGNYYYTTVAKTNVTPDVGGSIILISQ